MLRVPLVVHDALFNCTQRNFSQDVFIYMLHFFSKHNKIIYFCFSVHRRRMFWWQWTEHRWCVVTCGDVLAMNPWNSRISNVICPPNTQCWKTNQLIFPKKMCRIEAVKVHNSILRNNIVAQQFLRQKGRPSLLRQRDRRYTSWDEYSFSIALRLI